MTDAGFDFNAFQRQVIEEFRANQGRVGGPFEGADLVLLTTIGARTGAERTSPLGVLTIDGTPVVVASAMGADRHPAWFHNLLRHPVVTVETGAETYEAVAVAPTGAERDALFAKVVAQEPGFGDYQGRTSRRIPVVTLTRIDAGRAGWARGLGDFLVEAHDWLRAELTGLRRQVDDLIAGGDSPLHTGTPDLGRQMRAHCLEFCAALHQHHTGEDRGGFPMLAQRFPGLAPVLAKLTEEHVVVARLQEQLRALVGSYQPGRTDLVRLRADLEELATRLEDHFRYEERIVVSALNTMGPAPDLT
jgi:deazaflavin-dependent oxidoreductase (nitroreductase family)